MGGSGSGNHYYHRWRPPKKTAVEDCLPLDANRWAREGVLKAGVLTTGSWRWTYSCGRECSVSYEVSTLDLSRPALRLWYTVRAGTPEAEAVNCHVRLAATQPRFGGLRWWFLCPLASGGRACARRAVKLCLPPGAVYFGCRHCHDLTYTSCQESRKHDALYRLMARNTGWDFATVKWALASIGKRR